jgi:2'-5' RNA ligase
VLRLFVGLKLPETVRRELSMIASGLPGARWVAPENLHMTLRFIGEIDEITAEDVDGMLSGIVAPDFELSLTGVDCFHTRGRVRTVWAGVTAGPGLAALQSKVESAAVRAGLTPEGRKFKAHVALARLKNVPLPMVQPYLELNAGFRSSRFRAGGFTLFRSHLGRSGADYEALVEYPLASVAA